MSINVTPAQVKRPIHHHLLAIFAAPLAHWHHRRYAGQPHHLVIDTTLNIVIWALVAWLISTLVTTIVTDVPHASWSGPVLVSGQASELTWTLQSYVPGEFHHVTVKPSWPTTWTVSTPTELTISELNHMAPRTAVFQVTPHDSPDTVRTIMTTVTWVNAGRTFTTRITQQFHITGTVLVLNVDAPATVQQGEQFTMNIRLGTTSAVAQTGIAVEPMIPTGVSVIAALPPLDQSVWGLDRFEPGASKTFSLTLRMDRASGVVRLGAKVGFVTVPGYEQQMMRTTDVTVMVATPASIITTNPVTTPTLATTVSYRSAAGTQFGFGPIPPRAGLLTSYRAFWYLGAGQETATNVTVRMQLPRGVSWSGHTSLSGGVRLTYDPALRQVTWTIGTLSAGGGPISASFDLGVVPGSANVGQAMTVTGLATMSYRLASNTVGTITARQLLTTSAEGAEGVRGIVQK